MSDRGLDAGFISALSENHVNWFPMVKMEFDSGTVRVAGVDFDVEYPVGSGDIWTHVRGFASMEPITETGDSVEGLKFVLAGVPNALIVEAQQEKYQGRPCTVLFVCIEDGVLHVDPEVWRGRLDAPTIDRAVGSCTITVTAEHSMADWRRKRELLFNSASQKLINPADTFFDGIENSKRIDKIVFSKAARTV